VAAATNAATSACTSSVTRWAIALPSRIIRCIRSQNQGSEASRFAPESGAPRRRGDDACSDRILQVAHSCVFGVVHNAIAARAAPLLAAWRKCSDPDF
jgi:hypothetical protein